MEYVNFDLIEFVKVYKVIKIEKILNFVFLEFV